MKWETILQLRWCFQIYPLLFVSKSRREVKRRQYPTELRQTAWDSFEWNEIWITMSKNLGVLYFLFWFSLGGEKRKQPPTIVRQKLRNVLMSVITENHNMTWSVRIHAQSVHDQTSARAWGKRKPCWEQWQWWLSLMQVGGYLFHNSSLSLKPNVKTIQLWGSMWGLCRATERSSEEMCLRGSPGLAKIFCQNKHRIP